MLIQKFWHCWLCWLLIQQVLPELYMLCILQARFRDHSNSNITKKEISIFKFFLQAFFFCVDSQAIDGYPRCIQEQIFRAVSGRSAGAPDATAFLRALCYLCVFIYKISKLGYSPYAGKVEYSNSVRFVNNKLVDFIVNDDSPIRANLFNVLQKL